MGSRREYDEEVRVTFDCIYSEVALAQNALPLTSLQQPSCQPSPPGARPRAPLISYGERGSRVVAMAKAYAQHGRDLPLPWAIAFA